ncbi:GNAT family N-acetyltransferase [Nocardiopsis dassonvillei]|uniref:GNAT family N-acetyltransferase n=1 Tax=Nocardiopsis dassonvillei TaxID=2014 RepID=UPI00200D9ADD|nr:GNAT family N-acetyltransferase [Nocardiopsis dassonvillei]MCK9873919.1 GNAT family N-acetyltransferase [Nocardiopsis dassonvillei]
MLLVAVDDDGLPVGWLAGTFDGAYPGPSAPVLPPHGYVQSIVDPAAHRTGVGRQLLEAFTAAADEAPGVTGWMA